MSALLGLAVGLLFAISVYHLLGKDLVRMAVGVYMLLNAINLLVLSVATLPGAEAPLGQLKGPHVDPLVQAMVLTAIVIGFGVTTFFLLLSARLSRERGSLDAEAMREWRDR